jgi:hypothetical protein
MTIPCTPTGTPSLEPPTRSPFCTTEHNGCHPYVVHILEWCTNQNFHSRAPSLFAEPAVAVFIQCIHKLGVEMSIVAIQNWFGNSGRGSSADEAESRSVSAPTVAANQYRCAAGSNRAGAAHQTTDGSRSGGFPPKGTMEFPRSRLANRRNRDVPRAVERVGCSRRSTCAANVRLCGGSPATECPVAEFIAIGFDFPSVRFAIGLTAG